MADAGKRVLLILTIILFGLGSATQYVAYSFDYHAALGEPIFTTLGHAFYAPWQFVFWDLNFGEETKEVFFLAWGILLFVTLLGGIVVLGRSLPGANGTTSTTHGSAEWASDGPSGSCLGACSVSCSGSYGPRSGIRSSGFVTSETS